MSEVQTPESLFDEGIERYNAGEDPEALIPLFREVCDRAKKSSPSWTCLSWLYLLADKPERAYKAAQKAVKLNPQDPQARVNLAMAMLETERKGVRTHIEVAQQLAMVPELQTELEESFADGLKRKPDWASLQRVRSWLFG